MSTLQTKLASYRGSATDHAGANGAPRPTMIPARSQSWQKLIDDQLIEWGRSPEDFEEEGLSAPSSAVVGSACEFAQYCRDHDIDPPLRAAPDASGGIVFEWRVSPFFYTVEIHANGQAEMIVFENSKLVVRQPIG